MSLRQEYIKNKISLQEAKKAEVKDWLNENVVFINERMDRARVKRLINLMLKFDQKFGPFKDKIPGITSIVADAENALQMALSGRLSNEKIADIFQRLSIIYSILSDFFANDLKVLLQTPAFKIPRTKPEMRLDSITDSGYSPKHITDTLVLTLTPSENEMAFLNKLYKGITLPQLDRHGIASQMLGLSYKDLENLCGMEHVPMASVPEKIVSQQTHLNEDMSALQNPATVRAIGDAITTAWTVNPDGSAMLGARALRNIANQYGLSPTDIANATHALGGNVPSAMGTPAGMSAWSNILTQAGGNSGQVAANVVTQGGQLVNGKIAYGLGKTGAALTKAKLGTAGAGQIAASGKVAAGVGKAGALATKAKLGAAGAGQIAAAGAGAGGIGLGTALAGAAGAGLAGFSLYRNIKSKLKPQTDALGNALSKIRTATRQIGNNDLNQAIDSFTVRYNKAMNPRNSLLGGLGWNSDRAVLGQAQAVIQFYDNFADAMDKIAENPSAQDINGKGADADTKLVNDVKQQFIGSLRKGTPFPGYGGLKNLLAMVGFQPKTTNLPSEFKIDYNKVADDLIGTLTAPGAASENPSAKTASDTTAQTKVSESRLRLKEKRHGMRNFANEVRTAVKTLDETLLQLQENFVNEDMDAFMARKPNMTPAFKTVQNATDAGEQAEVSQLATDAGGSQAIQSALAGGASVGSPGATAASTTPVGAPVVSTPSASGITVPAPGSSENSETEKLRTEAEAARKELEKMKTSLKDIINFASLTNSSKREVSSKLKELIGVQEVPTPPESSEPIKSELPKKKKPAARAQKVRN